jgi:phosphoglycolate phosphatase-like HAD superfamily hydrolase
MEGLVFLDFDGVICDSLLECLVSSWQGYYKLHLGKQETAVPITLRRAFSKLRPFVRAGEDFILIQELINNRFSIQSQEQFDAQLAERGEETMARYKELFYTARHDFLANHRHYWIGLNRIYPHVYRSLRAWAASPCLYILSTKKADYIVEILEANDIRMDPHRVLSCGAKEKKETILRTLDERGCTSALFIDDQIDHLTADWARDPRIIGCLASWGYVKIQWLEEPRDIEILHADQLAERVDCWLQHCPPSRE